MQICLPMAALKNWQITIHAARNHVSETENACERCAISSRSQAAAALQCNCCLLHPLENPWVMTNVILTTNSYPLDLSVQRGVTLVIGERIDLCYGKRQTTMHVSHDARHHVRVVASTAYVGRW
jgi:hypothetical protein